MGNSTVTIPTLTTPVSPTSGGTGTGTAFTAGSVVFAGASGVYTQDNTNLFFDDTNNRLGIGTNSLSSKLHVSENNASAPTVTINQSATNGYHFNFTGDIIDAGGSTATVYKTIRSLTNGSSIDANYGVLVGISDCFVEGTMVWTPEGEKEITTFIAEDIAYSCDLVTGEPIENTVTKIQHLVGMKGFLIRFNEGIICSHYHKFWVGSPTRAPDWKVATDIMIGEYFTTDTGERVWIYAIDYDNETVCDWYNLKMAAPYHNYYVKLGTEKILTHNKCPFLYAYDRFKRPTVFQGQAFLIDVDAPKKETIYRWQVRTITNVWCIRELEPEQSFIKNQWLIAEDAEGNETRLNWTDRPEGEYINIKQGQQLRCVFELIPEGTVKLFHEAEGYYTPYEHS